MPIQPTSHPLMHNLLNQHQHLFQISMEYHGDLSTGLEAPYSGIDTLEEGAEAPEESSSVPFFANRRQQRLQSHSSSEAPRSAAACHDHSVGEQNAGRRRAQLAGEEHIAFSCGVHVHFNCWGTMLLQHHPRHGPVT